MRLPRVEVAAGYWPDARRSPEERLCAAVILNAKADVENYRLGLHTRAAALRWLVRRFGRARILAWIKRTWPEMERRRRIAWNKGRTYHYKHKPARPHARSGATRAQRLGLAMDFEQRASAERA